ncbi:enoyl-CoA hydratase-related protein (plasmid) [Sphingobium sp. SJ10-10]|uniref:enoyl-CoA hydratase-related protein n=1 Tax=Sphingobium sp. SJ10-10 TaxID=3114999 RepID=UPI002E1868BE|nr:enoyl-CoA hydratase-related protein [Sphingobium sp. SJ10-10]
MNQPVSISVEGDVGVVSVDSPPVNALGAAVRAGLAQAFDALLTDGNVRAIVLICDGRTFFAGADISEFGKPPQSPTLHEVMRLIENAAKPVVAAIHGSALGGGLETALVCHYRIAVPSARLGLPEVHLGLLPGGGGTQRLPRVIGVEAALDLMVSGRSIAAQEARELGLLDQLASENRLREDAVAFARGVAAAGKPLTRIRDRDGPITQARARPGLFDDFRRRHAAVMRGFRAPDHIVRAVEAAITLPFEEGMAREWELFRQLEDSSESAAQRYLFFSEREAARLPGISADTPVIPLRVATIVGKGECTPWADLLHRAGLKATCFESWAAVLANGQDSLAASDIIVECRSLPEPLTDAILQRLDAVRSPQSLLVPADIGALDEMASAYPATLTQLSLPAAPLSRLMEISPGTNASPTTLASILGLARKAGRVAVICRSGHGLVSDRLIRAQEQAITMLRVDGAPEAALVEALDLFGFVRAEEAVPTGCSMEELETLIAPMMAMMANEGARMLDESVVLRASDIDMVAVLAIGWPAYRGGPMFWADRTGLSAVVEKLHQMEQRHGPAFAPATGLTRLAESGGRFAHN